jgi:hypothetical protein
VKLKDLIPKLQALNPEAEVWSTGPGGFDSAGPAVVGRICMGKPLHAFSDFDRRDEAPGYTVVLLTEEPTP